MRILLPAICGFLIGAAVSSVYHAVSVGRQDQVSPEAALSGSPGTTGSTGSPPRRESGPEAPRPPAASPAAAPERTLASAQPSTLESSPLPSLESLLVLLQTQSGPVLGEQIERLLRAGPAGFPVLLEFLREGLRRSDFSAFQEGRLSFSLLKVAVLDQERVAEFAEYLLPLLSEDEDQELRQQVLRLLPPFLAASGNRFPALAAAFQHTLVADVQRAEEQIEVWRLLEAMDTLGMKPPVEPLDAILSDPKREKQHSLIIQQLGKRNDLAGLEALAGHVETFRDFNHWSVRESLQAISLMTLPEAADLFQQYLSSPSVEMRATATLAYFSSTRDLGALPLAIRFLNSEGELAQKQNLLEKLRQRSPTLFEALEREPGVISDHRLRLHLTR